MALYPNYTAQQRLTASSLRAGQILIAYKTIDTNRASTTTFADDPDLQLLLDADAVYSIEFFLNFAGLTVGGFKTAWRIPSGASGLKGIRGPGSSATDGSANNILLRSGVHGTSGSFAYGTRNDASNASFAYETGVLTTSDAGSVAIQWAQVTSNATATRMSVGSWARARRIA